MTSNRMIGKRRKGDSKDPFLNINESLQIYEGKVLLTEIPERYNQVEVINDENFDMYEIQEGTISDNEFIIDYDEGVAYFSEFWNGRTLNFKYKGTGFHYFPMSRVWTEENGDVVKTLEDVVNSIDDGLAVIDDINKIKEENNIAKDNAETQTLYAQQQGDYAKETADNLKIQGDYAKQQGDYAKAQGLDATNKANNAQAKAELADSKATLAQQQADYAKQQGDFAKTQGSTIDTRIKSAEDRVGAVETVLKETDKATQLLQHGVNVVNATQSSPLSVEIQGKTLVNQLGQKTLDINKYYVFSPNRGTTKINVNGTISETLTKFAGSTLDGNTVKTDFTGKASGSLVENGNIMKAIGNGAGLQTPSQFTYEVQTGDYNGVNTLNSLSYKSTATINNNQAQHLFSFDIIRALEKSLGTDVWAGKTLLADKIEIANKIVKMITCVWWGYGSSPTGNKASVSFWNGSTWNVPMAHMSENTAKLERKIIDSIPTAIDSNGIVYFLAYAEPSDSVTPSTLHTDFVELVITTNYVKPIKYLLKQDFRRKVAGSTVENGHIAKRTWSASTLTTLMHPTIPDGNAGEVEQDRYNKWATIDGVSVGSSVSADGAIAQNLFSFDIIRILEDKYGSQIWQGKTALADKITIAKQIGTKLSCNWWGKGFSSEGNKAIFTIWYPTSSQWYVGSGTTHTNGFISKITINPGGAISSSIDANGFAHFLAYTDPASTTVISNIETDYIELELEVNTTLPLLEDSLYEVDKATYDKINVDPAFSGQALIDKFPYCEGVQHLNPVVVSEGENLVPPFTEWVLHANAKVISPYTMELNVTANGQNSYVRIPVVSGQKYTVGWNFSDTDTEMYVEGYKNGVWVKGIQYNIFTPFTFIAGSDIDSIGLGVRGKTGKTGLVTIKDIYCFVGDKAKPFVPRNPSYLYTDVKLAGLNGVNDVFYKQDGTWKVLRKWVRDVELNGSLTWTPHTSGEGFKTVYVVDSANFTQNMDAIVEDFKNSVLRKITGNVNDLGKDTFYTSSAKALVISTPNEYTGFAPAYTPIGDEIKAYFNGWQVKTADGTGKPTAWKSIVDGTDAPTQTLAYVKANRATNYTPYKLTYQLAKTVVETVQVEGDISVDGLTQVAIDSGIVVREKIVPFGDGITYYINRTSLPNSLLKNKVKAIVAIYKNGIKDEKWTIISDSNANGLQRASTLKENFDDKAEYTVTYMMLDKHKHTSNATDVKVTYNQSVRSSLDEVVVNQIDNTTDISVMKNILTDVLARLKANNM